MPLRRHADKLNWGIIVMLLGQLTLVAVSYGRVTAALEGLTDRVARVERILDSGTLNAR